MLKLRIFAFVSFSLSAAFLLASCSGHSGSGSDASAVLVPAEVNQVPITAPVYEDIGAGGDPENLVAGTDMVSRIPKDAFKEGEFISFQGRVEFTTAGQTAYGSPSEIGKEIKDGDLFQFRTDEDGKIALQSKNTTFHFSQQPNGSLTLDSATSPSRTHEIRFLHFSATPDGRVFSLLFLNKSRALKDKKLTVFYFSRFGLPQTVLKKLPEEYIYNYGAGVKVRWPTDQDLNIGICTGFSAQTKRELIESVGEWSKALGARLKINIEEPKVKPPFSDLNRHCIYAVSGYRSTPVANSNNLGSTPLMADGQSYTYFDNDIFIYRSEFEKSGKSFEDPENEHKRRRSFLHELGHFLGLGHQWKYTSTMNYDYGLENILFQYDQLAIQALYAD